MLQGKIQSFIKNSSFLRQATEVQTCPPPRGHFSGLVNQWVIYDRYMTYEAAKEQAEEFEANKDQMVVKTMRRRLNEEEEESYKEVVKRQMIRSARILERMVNQNNHNEISLGNRDSLMSKSFMNLSQTSDFMMMVLMNLRRLKEHFYLFGSLHLSKQENSRTLLYVGTQPTVICLLPALGLVSLFYS